MANLSNSKTVELIDGVLHFTEDTIYTINFRKFTQILAEGLQTTNVDNEVFAAAAINAADLHKIVFTERPAILNLGNIDFIGADESGTGGAEMSVDLDAFLQDMLSTSDAGDLAAMLRVEGDQAGAFELIWEFLDDGYVAQGYYASVNENFVQLGIEYLRYLADGGTPLTDSIGKFTPDDGDANTTPERLQSLHDNLLGNLGQAAIQDRFGSAKAAELIAEITAIDADVLTRPYYSGNEAAGAAYDAVRAYDYNKGYARTDYIETFFGEVDARATDGGNNVEMIFGDGNSDDHFAITRHEGAGVELALKAKLRGIGDYADDKVTYNADGTATFEVSGTPMSADRAEWNVDWAATVTEAGDDDQFEFRFLVDIDGSSGEQFVDLTQTGSQYTGGTPNLQNSWNYGFFNDAIYDTTNGAGDYTMRLEAWDDGVLIAEQEINVLVS